MTTHYTVQWLPLSWWWAQRSPKKKARVGRRQGYNCKRFFGWQASWITELQLQSGNTKFWGQVQLEGDRATTAIWELEIFGGRPSWWQGFKAIWEFGRRQGHNSNLETRDFCRPSWKVIGLQVQSGNLRFFTGVDVTGSNPPRESEHDTEVFDPSATAAFRRLIDAIDNSSSTLLVIDEQLYSALGGLSSSHPWSTLVLDLKGVLSDLNRHFHTHLLSCRPCLTCLLRSSFWINYYKV